MRTAIRRSPLSNFSIFDELSTNSKSVYDFNTTTADYDVYSLNANNYLSYKIQIDHITEFNISGTYESNIIYKIILYIVNAGSGPTIIWDSDIQWSGGSPPSFNAAGLDIVVFTTINGGTTWQGSVAGLGYV